jgi:hypothetical protein
VRNKVISAIVKLVISIIFTGKAMHLMRRLNWEVMIKVITKEGGS